MNDALDRLRPLAHNLFRIMFGFLFFVHGAQKILAWFGREEAVDFLSRFGAAGFIEITAGTLIMLGLFTRPAAFLASGEMAVAYFWMHTYRNGSLWPWVNRGETVALFCFAFLLLSTIGGGSFSLDAMLSRNKSQ